MRKRRTHPSPSAFAQEIEDIIDSLDDLIPLYAEIDEYVYGQVDVDGEDAGKVSGGGVSDPTQSAVFGQEGNKAQLRKVNAELKRIKAIIDGTERNKWDGIKEKLLKIYDPPNYTPLAEFQTGSYGNSSDRRAKEFAGKVDRYRSRVRRLERILRRAG